jgi:phosphonate transport system substrate-binding protein
VRDGRYDIGAVNSSIARKMMTDGRIDPDELQVIWETPPYADYVWAVQPQLDETTKISLRDAFLLLDDDQPGHGAILDNLDAKFFLPADPGDFGILGNIARELGMLEADDR